ncbi:DAK2 domain-containing protein [Mesorhizobium sp. M2D.F.Ca.ET.185.01.1.1]|uniref:dihydroxyacetone kinase subunit DhaK n=2 Tax=Mesorhizobium TaxID=68287 RepID=UPI000FCA0B90|nr:MULTISPECIES: dihydroxyacetone kinase subunit DhaK [unclassified Mesorhizobium]TGP78234.1 DAK2 domain-containing protein [bacterium M00.F.Ca.ET.227.01.1.1]TGP88355.1 DAK2 domain-containing protein [bacterium M00.F.Ca.ET.221.01.1.1]TGP93568.1 DAK2 domain-containing protein [bacterium M00.F.Ca.ET.222.01.1.1]TGU12859.1 DAK2 domain-containing protein [bacterium M00.F.Ca.ET.163.01.1.1]TGU31342.1 DAK2 domain-containing protein [bacterium M00.F.Ca.ET.156.01.1.1]TGU45543.1 DAK2 domain-containing p
MKHFFNRKDTIVTEALDGFLATAGSGTLARLDGYPEIKVVLRADWDKTKVAVVSGGGAGHEPSHAGFVGAGMLTAAVSGEIFASPSVEAVLAAIRATTGPAGCLLIVKNYTGDRLNFGLAAEKARAEGLAVEMVIVADDVALPDIAQPRGVAGTLFVHKIAGYLSESGHDLASVAAAARGAAKDIFSLGISLSSCSIPGQAHEERFGANDGELGLGIHGEPGVERIALQSAGALVAIMAERLAARLDTGSRYALLINNLGSVPPVEMSLIANAVLASPLAKVVALTIGPGHLMTALNMNGFSLSLLKLDAEREAALLAPVGPHAWLPAKPVRAPVVVAMAKPVGATAKAASRDAAAERLITAVCQKLIALEEPLNALDAKAGDGDTGSTVATGARSVLDRIDTLPLADKAATLATIGDTLGASMGGSSGVLLSIFFTAAAQTLGFGATLPKALLAGLGRMTFYGGAKVGDRTMVDALEPALKALDASGLEAAAKAARQGADATAAMQKAKAGRSAYIGRQLDIADPGAFAVAEVFAAVAALFAPA